MEVARVASNAQRPSRPWATLASSRFLLVLPVPYRLHRPSRFPTHTHARLARTLGWGLSGSGDDDGGGDEC